MIGAQPRMFIAALPSARPPTTSDQAPAPGGRVLILPVLVSYALATAPQFARTKKKLIVSGRSSSM